LAAKNAIEIHKSKNSGPDSIYHAIKKIVSGCDTLFDLHSDSRDLFVEYYLNESKRSVILSTIHSSKGSGYKYVFLLDGSQFTFSEKMKFSKRVKKEQAMLLYVAITRAEIAFKAYYSRGHRLSKLLLPYKTSKDF
jgi:superfamily I DNA/RNA helicase